MAHLPENSDDPDATSLVEDPVVRAPKSMVVVPDAPSFAPRTMLAISVIAVLVGGSLGGVGIAIVYAARVHPAWAASRMSASRAQRSVADAMAPVAITLDNVADAASAPPPQVPAGPESNYVATHQRLGRGHTLPMVLRGLGLSNDLSTRVIRALRSLLNMRSLQPSDVVVVQRDPDSGNDVRRVEYRRSETAVWAVTIAAGVCTAEQVQVTKTTSRLVTGFVVRDTLDAALHEAHLQPDIIPRLQEVFDAVSLGHELRRGDAVRLIVSEERLNGIFFRYGAFEAVEYRGAMGQRRAFFQRIGAHGGDWFDAHGVTFERGPLRAPLTAARMTSPFNMHRLHPILHVVMPHLGTDFGAAVGTPVYAAADGDVLSVGGGGPTGNLVRVAHPALGIETGYAHLSRFAPGIHAGLHVRARQLVGYVGSTGRSTGPHLHFSCKRHDQFFDCQTLYHQRRSVPELARGEFDGAVARVSGELDGVRLSGEGTPAPSTGAPNPAPDDAEEAPPASEDPPTEDTTATE